MSAMPRTTLYVMTLLLCAAPAAARAAETSTERTGGIGEEFREAQRLLNRGETAQALAALQRIPRTPPEDPSAALHAGTVPSQPPVGIDETAPPQAPESPPPPAPAVAPPPPPEYQRAPSDRSLEEVLEVMDAAFRRISSVHYRKIRGQPGATPVYLEESWYQSSPVILKSHLAQYGQHVWLLVRNGRLKTFDPDRGLISIDDPMDWESGWLMELRQLNAAFLREQYDLTVERLTAPPAFLGSLYDLQPTARLYLITGRPRERDAESWPSVARMEYVVDADRGLLVGFREYWRAGFGGWPEEELATTDVITQWASYPDSIVLPVAGINAQRVDEPLGGHHLERTTWWIELESLNAPLADGVFDLSDYTHEPPSSQ